MTKPGRIIVLSGLPGVGKSTTAQLLATHFDRAAHVEADRLQSMVVSGAHYPTPEGTSEEALAQLTLRLENSVAVAKIFSANGFDAIVDEIIHAERFAQLVSLLDGQEFYFVTLLRSLEEMKQRWHAMNSPYAEKWDWLDRDIREATPRVGLWLDTTGQTPDESVAEILQRLDEALVRQS